MTPEEKNPKVHHQTARAARLALARKEISQESYRSVLAGELSLDRAKKLGREGAPSARTSRGGSRAATGRVRSASAEGEAPGKACLCGCGESVTNRFRPGHDQRLFGELRHNLERDPLLRNERFSEEQKAYAWERGLI
jgi:hypothetical protein